MKTRSTVMSLAALGVVVALIAVPFAYFGPSPATLPGEPFPKKEIKSIKVELHGTTITLDIAIRAVPPFEVPAQYHATILSFFEPPLQCNIPAKITKSLGSLDFIYEDGDTVRVSLLWIGVEKVVYSIDDKFYTRDGPYCSMDDGHRDYVDESALIYGILEELYEATVQEAPSDRIARHLKTFKKSAGRAP